MQFNAWQKAVISSDVPTMNDIMSRTIKTWEYDSDPSLLASYDYLTLEEWCTAVAHMKATIDGTIAKSVASVLQRLRGG